MLKKDKVKRCQDILKSKKITEDDFNFLIELFKNHPDYKNKFGVGIKKIDIIKTIYGNYGFLIVRKDNSHTDISYKKCLCPSMNSNKLNLIKKACRSAIFDVIKNFKDNINYESDVCAISGERLNKNEIHIDHYNLTFNELFNNWIKYFDIDFLLSQLNDYKQDNEMEVYFINKDIIDNFIDYHNKNTNLRAITIKAHKLLHSKKL